MAITNIQLVDYAKAQIGRPYWFGTFGQKASTSLLTSKKKQYPDQYTATDFSAQAKAGQKVHDCGGLIKGALMTNADPNAIPKYSAKYDVGSDTMLQQATEKGDIKTLPEIAGVLVFKKGHVGVYIGGGKVVEARGHKYGVIESKLSDMPWTHWGKHKDIEYIGGAAIPVIQTKPVQNDVPTNNATNYTVKAGDTLSGICGRFGVKVADVVRWNNIANPNLIRVGQVLKLTGAASAPTSTNKVVTLTVNAKGGLRLRATPNGSIILVMPNDSKVEKIGADGKWFKVNYNGKTGYCYSDYLK